MKFNSTTDRDGIIQEIERMTDLGIGYISGDTNRLADMTATVNRVNSRVWHSIFLATGNWSYDDSNNNDLPVATTALVVDQDNYTLPTESLTVERVEVKDEDNNWYRLTPIITEGINGAVDEFMDVSGRPSYYRVLGNIVYLHPASDYAQDASLKVYYDRESASFTTADTTKTPGFASPYHEIIPIKASIEWLKIKQPQSPTLPILLADEQKIDLAITQFYARRYKDYKPKIGRAKQSFK